MHNDAAHAPDYDLLNAALNATFFGGRYRLAPVFLDLESELIGDAAARVGVEPDEFITVMTRLVRTTLRWQPGQSPYQWHLHQLAAWDRAGREEPPPFTALLAALALAAEHMRSDEHFSSQNYYVRLFEVFGAVDETEQNRLRNNAADTKILWEALNLWLADNDFELGRPTAKPAPVTWEYAGYALSQALVRKADRARFHSLFRECRLSPHERITEPEMQQYLYEWMRGAEPTPWLKRIWKSQDLRSRIAAAACAELEAWDGAVEGGEDGVQERKLSWALSLETFPAARLHMYLSAAARADVDTFGLQLASGAPEAARAAFADANGLHLTRSIDGAISILEPVAQIGLNSLMLAPFTLMSEDGAIRFVRSAKPVIPLGKLDGSPYYREVSRVSFLRPHAVLCHEQWRERAESLLQISARQGYRVWRSAQLRGLPADWLLFSGVQIMRRAPVTDTHLAVLTPLADGIAIDIDGGVRISQGVYHCSAAPEITANMPQGNFTLRLTDPAGGIVEQAHGNICRLALSKHEPWPADNFTIEAVVEGRVRSSAQISFRSADTPRRARGDETPKAYGLDEATPSAALSATAASAEAGVSGLVFRGVCEVAAVAAASGPPLQHDGADEDPPGLEDYKPDSASGLRETCILRGRHEWRVDAFNKGDDPHAPFWRACADCGSHVLSPPNRIFKKRRKGGSTVIPVPRPPQIAARRAARVHPDMVYDALCYLGQGTWKRFQDLTAAEDTGALAAHTWASNLTALGFADFTLDADMRAPVSWQVTPPVLIFTNESTAFFSGFRSSVLLLEINARMQAAGALTLVEERDFAPSALHFTGVTLEAAKAALDDLEAPGFGKILVAMSPAAAIACAHPSATALQSLMRPIGLERVEGLKRFDPASALWRSAENSSGEGAYRGDYAGRRYFYVSADGKMTEGPYWLVKLRRARRAQIRLHGYDAARDAFQAVLGCDLPPLLQRALCATSGHLPFIENGKLLYRGAGAQNAAQILAKLYSEDHA